MSTDHPTEVPPAVAVQLIRFACRAADAEALTIQPRGEREHERIGRCVEAAVLHLVEQGLLVVPGDFEARLDQPVPLTRTKNHYGA